MSDGAPIVLAREDRLGPLFAPITGLSRATLAVLAGSAACHLVIVATALVTGRAPLVVPQEQTTSVEIVQEAPKQAQAQTPSPKPEPSKLDVAKGEPLLRSEALPPAPAKTQAQLSPAQASPPKPLPPEIEPAKVEPLEPKPATKAPATPVADEREALRKELAELRAEQADLNRAETPPAVENPGMGALPSAFQAAALPASTEGAGEAMAYQDIVFSQLAKAKGFGRRQGMPGTTGVRFDIDAAGGLVDVEIVHPSGVAALDAEALDIVHRAAPFPAPPAGAQRNFTANVTFVVQGAP